MTDHAEREAAGTLVRALLKRDRHARAKLSRTGEKVTVAYADLFDAYRLAVLASARERVEALVPTYRAFAGDDELLINRDLAARAITEAT